MELILVTGMSGAGKSVAVNALEDVGFFCVDNIPASLAAKFVELCTGADSTFSRVAIVVDIRSREHHQELCSCFRELRQKETPYRLLFLDCDDATIHHRYKETRRKHPLVKEGVSMEEALQTERQYLQEARLQADYVIDTSLLTASQLRDRIFTVSVLLPDKPGELAKVSELLAREQGNIIKLEHNQFVSINRNAAVELRITMEAFGTEHKNQIVAALTSEGYRPKLVKFKGTFSEM